MCCVSQYHFLPQGAIVSHCSIKSSLSPTEDGEQVAFPWKVYSNLSSVALKVLSPVRLFKDR